jgi:hypothetical protein
VQDKTLKIIGIREFGDYATENARHRIAGHCAHLNSERLRIEELKTGDSGKIVWVVSLSHAKGGLGRTWPDWHAGSRGRRFAAAPLERKSRKTGCTVKTGVK